eukprot:417997_1
MALASSTSLGSASGAAAKLIARLSPELLQAAFASFGVKANKKACEIACNGLKWGCKLLSNFLSTANTDYPPFETFITSAEFCSAKIVSVLHITKPLKNQKWASKISNAARHHFLLLRCVVYSSKDKKEFFMVCEYNNDGKVSWYFVAPDSDDYWTSDDIKIRNGQPCRYPRKYSRETDCCLIDFIWWCNLYAGIVTYDLAAFNCEAFAHYMTLVARYKTFLHGGWKYLLQYGMANRDKKKKALVKGFVKGAQKTGEIIDFVEKTCSFYEVAKKDCEIIETFLYK